MDIPKKITSQDFPKLWQYIADKKREAYTVEKQNSSCAIAGHVAFNFVLAVLGFFLGLWAPSTEGLAARDWCAELGSKFKALLLGITGEMNGATVLIVIASAVVLLLAVPFAASAICKLRVRFVRVWCGSDQPPAGTKAIKNAEIMIKSIDDLTSRITYPTWDDYYPMFEIGDMIEINAFNFIPWLCFLLPTIIAFPLGYQLSFQTWIGFSLLIAMAAFLLLLVIVPLWKLSAIINSVFFNSTSKTGLLDLENKLKTFIEDSERAEKERQEQIRRQQEEEKMKKAEALYSKATESNEPNIAMLKEAAELGLPAACLEYGRLLYLESISGKYTRAEREDKCADAAGFLEKAKDKNVEAKFLWLACRIMFEGNNSDGWREMLDQAREIKNSAKLPELYKGSLEDLINALIRQVDDAAAKEQSLINSYVSTAISSSSSSSSSGWDGAGANALPWGTDMIDGSGL